MLLNQGPQPLGHGSLSGHCLFETGLHVQSSTCVSRGAWVEGACAHRWSSTHVSGGHSCKLGFTCEHSLLARMELHMWNSLGLSGGHMCPPLAPMELCTCMCVCHSYAHTHTHTHIPGWATKVKKLGTAVLNCNFSLPSPGWEILRIIILDDFERYRLSKPIYANRDFNTENSVRRSIPSRHFFKNSKCSQIKRMGRYHMQLLWFSDLVYCEVCGNCQAQHFPISKFLGLVIWWYLNRLTFIKSP